MAGCILITQTAKLQTEYLRTRKSKVTLHRVPLYISEDHRGLFFLQSAEVSEVSTIKSNAEDVEIAITLNRKQLLEIPNTLMSGSRMIYVIVEWPVGPRVNCPRLAPEKSEAASTIPKEKCGKSRQQNRQQRKLSK